MQGEIFIHVYYIVRHVFRKPTAQFQMTSTAQKSVTAPTTTHHSKMRGRGAAEGWTLGGEGGGGGAKETCKYVHAKKKKKHFHSRKTKNIKGFENSIAWQGARGVLNCCLP